jgi:hypothetical protein
VPTYKNIDYVENVPGGEYPRKNDDANNNIFRQVQRWINKRGFFGGELNTTADERVLTGYEKTPLTAAELQADSQSIESKLNKDYDVHIIERYREYEQMDHVAEVSSSLDLIADECVQMGENNHVMQIYSENQSIKKLIEELFFKILKIDLDCWDKVRGMIKYGNRFEEVVINKKDPGVLYLNYIDPASIRRNELKGRLVNFSKVEYKDQTLQVTTYPTKEFANQQKNSMSPFRIIHFRIEDSDMKPYGKSVMESSRRTVRQLNMMEDAMTTYRYSRASEKRVWSIDCGEMSADEAMTHTTEIRDKLRKKPRYNPRTGEYDHEMNPLSITEDFFLPIRKDFTNNSVTQMAGAQNLGEIDDVLYFKKKLYAALKIPLAFIGEEGLSYAKSNLALIDIRFARMVERIQRFFVKGLEKIAIVHLLLKGKSIEEISGFRIEMTPASNIKKITDLEFMTNKFNAMSTAKGLELFPDIWIMTTLFGLPEDEAENLLKMVKLEKAGAEMGGAEGGAGGGALGDVGADFGGTGEMDIGAEEGGGGEELGGDMGAEVPGGDAGEPLGGEEGEMLTSGANIEKMFKEKNASAFRIYEDMKNNPKSRKGYYEAYKTCIKKLMESQKDAKKTSEKKDNDENYLTEFVNFGELSGMKVYLAEADKNKFSAKKKERQLK